MKGGYWVTYKFYDDRGRRLSIFCEQCNKEELKITVITCSENDEFKRKTGRSLYLSGQVEPHMCKCHPQVFRIPIGDKPHQRFIEWCNNMYLRKVPAIYVYNGQAFTRGGMIAQSDHTTSKQLVKIVPGEAKNKLGYDIQTVLG